MHDDRQPSRHSDDRALHATMPGNLLYRGGLVSSAFRLLRRSDVGRHSQVLASLRDRHLGPPMMGSGGSGGPIYRGVLAIRLTAGIRTRNGLASSIVPAGTSLHRVGGIQFSPIAIMHN